MKKLKEFMNVNDISYRKIAKMLNTSPFTIDGLLNKNKIPTLKLAYEIEKLTFKKITVYDWLPKEKKEDNITEKKK